jgi:hypothetical protein
MFLDDADEVANILDKLLQSGNQVCVLQGRAGWETYAEWEPGVCASGQSGVACEGLACVAANQAANAQSKDWHRCSVLRRSTHGVKWKQGGQREGKFQGDARVPTTDNDLERKTCQVFDKPYVV